MFDMLDDFDHFRTKTISDSAPFCHRGTSCDDPSSRMAMKNMINSLDRREIMFLGELAACASLSLERAEIIVDHLSSIGAVSRLTNDELRCRGWMITCIVVKIERRVCEGLVLDGISESCQQ
jgi:hypothetical protein